VESIWSDEVPPPWHQLTRFLRDDDDVRALLADRLLATGGGRLTDLARPAFIHRSDATWFTGVWDGSDVVVKVNVTERERWWMSTISEHAPDAVAHVHASGTDLDGLDVCWLVLERLGGHAPDPPTNEWCEATLDAAAAFQRAARGVDSVLVGDEGLEFWERFVGVHARSAPAPVARLVSTLAEDLGWIDVNIERHALWRSALRQRCREAS
jgi:hypothetical protein